MSNNIQEIIDREFLDALRTIEEGPDVPLASPTPTVTSLQESDSQAVFTSVSNRTYIPIYEVGSQRPVTWIMAPPRHMGVSTLLSPEGNFLRADDIWNNPSFSVGTVDRNVGAEPVPGRVELTDNVGAGGIFGTPGAEVRADYGLPTPGEMGGLRAISPVLYDETYGGWNPMRMYNEASQREASRKLDLKIKKIEEDRMEEETREATRPAFDYEIF